jgi:hypothetical protein
MVLHVSHGKRVHQALVDSKSIVPYYVVWDRNVIPGPQLYLKGWFGAMAGQDDPVITPTKQ